MVKLSVVLLAGTEAHSDLARVLNALELVKEAKEAVDDVELVIDGAGVSWIPELNDPEHKLHPVFNGVTEPDRRRVRVLLRRLRCEGRG